jgi:methyl-accepting chemotaxis protein
MTEGDGFAMNALLEKLVESLHLRHQFRLLAALTVMALIVAHYFSEWPVIAGMGVFYLAIALWLGFRTAKRSETIAYGLQTVASGDLSQKIRISGRDDFAWMCYEADSARKGIASVIKGVTETASELQSSAQEMSGISARTTQAIASQSEHTSQIASSIIHLAEQVREVASQAVRVASSAKRANSAAVDGNKVVGETIKSLETISNDVQGIAESIASLQDEINRISSVMQVIRDISEQTNLLALNAAIEAARAGEAGRGFAVVADEVRKLSQRTDKSTVEITQILTGLQAKSLQVAKTVQEKQQDAKDAANSAKVAESALSGIVGAVGEIVSMSDTIAELTSQQESATGGITDAVTYIQGLSGQNASEAAAFDGMSQQLSSKADHLNQMVSKFKV